MKRALALLLLPGFALAARPTLETHDDGAKGRARVDGCTTRCSKWVQFPRSRPRTIIQATVSKSGDHFLVWSRAEGHARELDVFRVPGRGGGAATRLGHLVPGMGGELTWLPGERMLLVWGCGTGCSGMQVYAVDGAVLFRADGVLHEVARDGSVAVASHGGIMRVFDAATARALAFAGDPRLGTPREVRFGTKNVQAHFTAAQDEDDLQRGFVVTCAVERGLLSCKTQDVSNGAPAER